MIVEAAHDAFVGMNADGVITGWNRRAEAIFGWPREEAIGRPLAETIMPPAFREAHWRGLQRFLETGQGPVLNQIFEISALRRDGSEFPVELSIALEVALEPVAVGEVLREALELARPLAAEHDVRLHLDDSATRHAHSRVLADRRRLNQVLLNLLSNAVKYNREGGLVTVSVAEVANGRRLRLAVEDTGAGLTPEETARLFQLFDRIGAEEAGVTGTGIGLTLAKGLVEAMGGAIGVQSTLGQGSTFWIELPIAPGAAPQDGAPQDGQDGGRAGAARGATSAETVPQPQAVVLYIEDNLPNLNLVQHIMRQRPEIKLLTAMQGRPGLELARQHGPDLILLDLHLPDMNGDEVLRRLQADSATHAIPVVMVSADAMPRQIEQLLAAGASDYLTKPLDVKRFLEVLDDELGDAPVKGQTDDR